MTLQRIPAVLRHDRPPERPAHQDLVAQDALPQAPLVVAPHAEAAGRRRLAAVEELPHLTALEPRAPKAPRPGAPAGAHHHEARSSRAPRVGRRSRPCANGPPQCRWEGVGALSCPRGHQMAWTRLRNALRRAYTRAWMRITPKVYYSIYGWKKPMWEKAYNIMLSLILFEDMTGFHDSEAPLGHHCLARRWIGRGQGFGRGARAQDLELKDHEGLSALLLHR